MLNPGVPFARTHTYTRAHTQINSNDVEYVQYRAGDGFNEINAQMFKGVFRNCGIRAFETLKPHLTTLCASTDRHSHRTVRCFHQSLLADFRARCWCHVSACK